MNKNNDVLLAIYAQQSAARLRRDWQSVQFWERFEFVLKDAWAEEYGGVL